MKTGDEIYAEIEKRVEEAEQSASQWATKQEKWHKLRMRIKKSKTFPFPNCSNIRMPTGETKIRKIKAALINVIFGIRPVVQAIPGPTGNWDTARKIEKFLDHLVMDVMKLKEKAIIAIDQELEKGFYLFKPYWKIETTTRLEEISVEDFSVEELVQFFDPLVPKEELIQALSQHLEADLSERVRTENEEEIARVLEKILSGEKTVKFKLKDELCDYPDVALVSPEYCYVPTDTGFCVQSAEMIVHEYLKPLRDVKANVQGKGWDMAAVNDIDAMRTADKTKLTDVQKDMREGIERLNNPSQMVKIQEIYMWYDLDGDGEEEKCLFVAAPEFKKMLRQTSLPFDNGKWPFVKLAYEMIDDRWYSTRGLIELIEDIIKEIDIQHMQKIDQQTIRNTPMFVYRAGMVNPKLVQFIPNQAIPVHGMSDLRNTIDMLNSNNPNVEFSYEREEQILQTKIQELLGDIDFSLQSMINRREPRTKGEVDLQYSNSQQQFSLDVDMHVNAFSDLFNFIWDLWSQYGKDEYEFAYFGQDGLESIKLNREEIQGKYKIQVRGNDQNTNPNIKIQKANAIMQSVLNPIAIQSGVVGVQQIANAFKRFYQTLDIPNWEEFINVQPPPPQPQLPPIEPKFEDLADGEQAQVLAKHGIQPDVKGRALRTQMEVEDMNGQHAKGSASK